MKEVALTDDRGEVLRSRGTTRFVTTLVALDLTREQFGPRFAVWLGQELVGFGAAFDRPRFHAVGAVHFQHDALRPAL
jgi:hypothetical protein